MAGASRYDGKEFQHFPMGSGIDAVYTMYCDPNGVVWFGVENSVYRYDGQEFRHFTAEDGLTTQGQIHAIYSTPDGNMWFGGWDSGVYIYDGENFTNLSTKDGLVNNDVNDIYRDTDGIMWFATRGGISKYDGKEFVNFTKKDGVPYTDVHCIYDDSDGIMWFGTDAGGILAYDGTAWTSLDTRDGLAGNRAISIIQDSQGNLWIGSRDGGLTCYRRNTMPPKVRILSVTTDQTYDDFSAIPAFTVGTHATIRYSAIDFRTVPEKRQYRCRIKEIDSDWRKPTKESAFNHVFEAPGSYTFEVQAVNQDLNYSEPASLELKVVTPFYMRAAFLAPVLGVGLMLLLTSIISLVAYAKRRRQVHAYERMAVQELQDAREMQMSLLPERAPQIGAMEIAGTSIPANTVGGDFFDYLALPDGKIGIAIADVSGKGLRAAMNATMTNGMMHEVATIESSCGSILSRLNVHLYPLMERQMFTAFSFAILDPDAGVMQWANAAQPLPLIKRSSGASEADGAGEFPLGMAPDIEYTDYELEFQPGDIIIFYTDGIIEAENSAEEMYSTERLLDLVAGIDPSASAEDVIDAILQDVKDFVGSAEQYDDMTIVVVKRLENSDAP
jgi:serine phosphatase RsbU (regulator of sigma subunit)